MNNIASLPFLPISPSLFSEASFFLSADARIVRAGFWLLDAAWRSSEPGSIPVDPNTLMAITRLTQRELDANYEVLTKGWHEEDGRLHYAPFEAIAGNLEDRFGAELATFAESAVLACQGGAVQFELLPASEVKKKRTGKHLLPANFTPDKATLAAAINEGYTTPETQQWLMNQLSNYADAEKVLRPNWNAFLRKFLGSSITRKEFYAKFGYNLGHPPMRQVTPIPVQPGFQRGSPTMQQPQRVVPRTVPVSVQVGRATFTQMRADNNRSNMREAMAKYMPNQDNIVESPKN